MRLETERLILREWRDEDIADFTAIASDPEVRRFFPTIGNRELATASIERARQRLRDFGYSFMATELKQTGELVGMLGMATMNDNIQEVIPGHPRVEIGWQFGRKFWGQGLAPEGARAMLDYAWTTARLPEVVAVTFVGNLPSRRVMEKIGMAYDPQGDFMHPDIPEGHPLRPHVLYRIRHPALSA